MNTCKKWVTSSSILRSILNGRDTFACLPNGHRKPLISVIWPDCYCCCTNKTAEKSRGHRTHLLSLFHRLRRSYLTSLSPAKHLSSKLLRWSESDHDDKLKELEVCFRHALWALRNGSVAKPRSMLNTAIFDPWQRSLFSRQQTAGKEPLLAGKDACGPQERVTTT